jgi:hypothetical protein
MQTARVIKMYIIMKTGAQAAQAKLSTLESNNTTSYSNSKRITEKNFKVSM